MSALPPVPPPLATAAAPYAVRGQALIMARWMALFGQAITVLVAYYGLGFDFPLMGCLFFIILSGMVNNYATIRDYHRMMLPRRAFFYLVFDIFQLTGLLFLTGGMDNPFSVLLLAPVLVGASLLTRNYMVYLVLTGLTAATLISVVFIPLTWPQHFVNIPNAHLMTQSLGLIITLLFSGFYAWKIAEESRTIAKASYAAKTALLKQKQLQALGAQAAAAVHEIGSPLGTITIVAKELLLELGEDHPQSEDIHLLIDQTKRCQTILKDFGATLRHDPTYMTAPLPVTDLIQSIADGFLKEKPHIAFVVESDATAAPIKFKQSAEILHGLGVFIQNAIQFARTTVRVSLQGNSRNGFVLTIQDDGPGFSPHILSRLGEPYTSTRMDSGKNMGLGVFIAQTLLEDTGASIEYNNTQNSGAQVKLEWTEKALQAMFPNNFDDSHR